MNYKPDWDRMVECGKYRAVFCPDHPRAWSTGYVYIHTIVAEQKIGRLLEPGEVVHHEDENGKNNDPANIKVISSRGVHAVLHYAKPLLELTCPMCGKVFYRKKSQTHFAKKGDITTCSRTCGGRRARMKQLSARSSVE